MARSTTVRRRTAPDDEPLTPGQRLKQAIHVARARSPITSDTQLALAAGVHYDTLMNWFAGRTTPRPAEVKKIADVLGVSYGDLMASWEGREPEPKALQDAIRELVDEMRLSRAQQDEATLALLRALGAVARQAPAPPGTPGDSDDATHAGSRSVS